MKKYLFILTIMLCFNAANSQVLYAENFDNLTLGNVGTDFTGATPGQGGWYTYSRADNVPSDAGNNYFKIVSEPNKGKVLQTTALPSIGSNYLLKSGIDNLWNNRNQGNNVLKVTYDFFTGPNSSFSGPNKGFYIVKNSDFNNIVSNYMALLTYVPLNGGMNLGPTPFNLSQSQYPKLQPNTWYTLTFYIDYTNQKIYFSIPSLGFIVVHTSQNQIPTAVSIVLQHSTSTVMASDYKWDNFVISAVNTVPLNTKDFVSEKFNLYPNPATNVVNISNAVNMQVNQITVYTLAGKQVSTQAYNNQAEIHLNVENLASGTYLLYLQTAQGTAVKKLIKK